MKMINTAVNSLDRLDAILPAVQQLGIRHIGYGVKDEHYETVGDRVVVDTGSRFGRGIHQRHQTKPGRPFTAHLLTP